MNSRLKGKMASAPKWSSQDGLFTMIFLLVGADAIKKSQSAKVTLRHAQLNAAIRLGLDID